MIPAARIIRRVQIRVRKHRDRGAAETGDQTLIGIAQPVLLAPEIPHIRNIENRIRRKLELRSETDLLHIRRPLIGILRMNRQLS